MNGADKLSMILLWEHELKDMRKSVENNLSSKDEKTRKQPIDLITKLKMKRIARELLEVTEGSI